VDPTSPFLHKFVSEFAYLTAFSNASGSKSSDVENDAKLRFQDAAIRNDEGSRIVHVPSYALNVILRLPFVCRSVSCMLSNCV